MQKELLNHALALFDTPEKWNAFVEMAKQKDLMIYRYFQKLKYPLLKYFNENPVKGWICDSWGDPNFDFKWYIKDFGKNSLALTIGWRFEFHLHIEDISNFDTNKINELLKSDYTLLLSAFDRIDRQYDTKSKVVETRNYAFNSPYDSNFDNSQLDKLAWFAGNETERFAEQIINKVEKFRKNEILTKMLYEINERSRILSK